MDATNQSYYGEQKLHFLAADGSNDCLVPELKVIQLDITIASMMLAYVMLASLFNFCHLLHSSYRST